MKNLFSLKIKSFVLGRGRITNSQLKAIEKFGGDWILKPKENTPVEHFFKKKAPTTLEIGLVWETRL